jgi:hypothetical protein
MRLSTLATVAALLAVLAVTRPASADYEFRFADSSGNYFTGDAVTLDYALSPTLDIRVYLVATDGASNTALSTNGLQSYGVQLNYNGTKADVLNTGAIASNAAFTGAEIEGVGAGNVVSDFARAADSVATNVASAAGSDGNQRVLLATFTFTGIDNGNTATITTDPFPAFSNTVLGDGTVIDGDIFNTSLAVTVINVPEPGTLLLTGLLATGFGAFGAYRRFRPKAA